MSYKRQETEVQSVKVGWVLRDMMQSSGVWTFDEHQLVEFAALAAKAGFSHLEIGGGQSYQIALSNHCNPYHLIRAVKQQVDQLNAVLPLQVLVRGANQFGFHHFSPAVQRQNIDLLVDAGGDTDKNRAIIIRVFDALNDIENLRYSISYLIEKNKKSEVQGEKLAHLQVALSYVSPIDLGEDSCYSAKYYSEYVKQIIAVAQAAGGSIDSLCIKDMSGQLSVATVVPLIITLQQFELPIVLHCHSTDEARSLAVVYAAINAGISGVEVALEPLSGGASHHDISQFYRHENIQSLDWAVVEQLKSLLNTAFSNNIQERKDWALPLGVLKRLCDIGVPGGAIPFVIADLQSQVCSSLGVDLMEAIKLFEDELNLTQSLLGRMPLVTPTADIIAKQVIKQLGNRARSEKYQLMDPRFCALVLGHYGTVHNYATGEVVTVNQLLIDQIKRYCAQIPLDLHGRRTHAGKVFPEPEVLSRHPSTEVHDDELIEAREYVAELNTRYPESVARFGSVAECEMMQVMRPAGKTDRLLTHNILGPTETRLRLLLDMTLHLLPAKVIPESRSAENNEETDIALLRGLGDYEGIVKRIKDLVMHLKTGGIKQRLTEIMEEVVQPIYATNLDARNNKLYVERRFVALFAAAVFWDLQRICRRTGTDSRRDLDEMTANSLGKIISTTLRKRAEEGRGRADGYLV